MSVFDKMVGAERSEELHSEASAMYGNNYRGETLLLLALRDLYARVRVLEERLEAESRYNEEQNE